MSRKGFVVALKNTRAFINEDLALSNCFGKHEKLLYLELTVLIKESATPCPVNVIQVQTGA